MGWRVPSASLAAWLRGFGSLVRVIDEAAQWHRLAALLPSNRAQEFADCWEIGEQEAGLDALVAGLLAEQTAISERMRAEIAVATEVWGMWTALAPGIQRCLGKSGDDASLRLIEHAGTVPLDGGSIGTDAALAGLLVVPWIACTLCGHTLGRAHTREPWGDLSYLAERYVLFFPGQSTTPIMFDAQSAWSALDAVRLSCSQVTTGGTTAS